MKHLMASLTRITLSLTMLSVIVSCTTTGAGAMTGAMFGGVIGSSIGGIGGGWRGSNVGTLVGMAAGAATGAAIGAAAEAQERRAEEAYIMGERESVREHYRSLGINAKPDDTDDVYGTARRSDASGYSSDPVYDDRIELTPSTNNPTPSTTNTAATTTTTIVPAAVVEVSETGSKVTTPIVISNARFINDQNTTHIAKGELVKISFEVKNATGDAISNVVPVVKETTENKHLFISPSTLVERLAGHKAIRYTAYVSAEKSLKTGTAHFVISVYSNNQLISNTIEFDIDLN